MSPVATDDHCLRHEKGSDEAAGDCTQMTGEAKADEQPRDERGEDRCRGDEEASVGDRRTGK